MRGKDKTTAIAFLQAHITKEMQLRILNSKLIRYEYEAMDYKIDGVNIGNMKVKVTFDLNTVNLIGMHIIRNLYTKIYADNNQIFLLAKKNTPFADKELNTATLTLKNRLALIK